MVGAATRRDLLGVLYLVSKAARGFKYRIKLQKMVLIAKEDRSVSYPFSFEFVRYHYGPYSFELKNLIRFLVNSGYIDEGSADSHVGTGFSYKITPEGETYLSYLKKEMDRGLIKRIDAFWETYKNYTLDSLILRSLLLSF